MSDKQKLVELISAALVREYLSTKKFVRSLKEIDIEYPRNEESINSRFKLSEYLGLYRPCKGVTILEVLVQNSLPIKKWFYKKEKKEFQPLDNNKFCPFSQEGEEDDEEEIITCIKENNELVSNKNNSNDEEKLESMRMTACDDESKREEEIIIDEETNILDKQITSSSYDTDINIVIDSIIFDHQKQNNIEFLGDADQTLINLTNKNKLISNILESTLSLPLTNYDDNKVQTNIEIDVDINVSIPAPRVEIRPPDGATPLALPAAMQLKEIILGDTQAYFPISWKDGSINMNNNDNLSYGLDFHKEGTSGAIAALQGFLLKHLIFCTTTTYNSNNENILKANAESVRIALVSAIGDVLWQCGQFRRACLTIPTTDGETLLAGHGRYRCDGITEGLVILKFENNLNEVKNAVDKYLNILQSPGGCALFLCSAVLSRGLTEISEDMGDKCSSLLAHGGECAPELVSLVLTGRATMRQEKRDSRIPGSIPARADIGLLTLAEHYGHCQVGSFLKTPRYPIWLVLTQGHYSLLFSTRRQLVSDWRAELSFRLYLYNGSRQHEPIQLAVSTVNKEEITITDDDKTRSPIELVIRTKWNGASIKWINHSSHI